MSRDSNRFKIDPTVIQINSQGLGTNYGHAFSQVFKDLGAIENNKINIDTDNKKNEYEGIKLQTIRDELEDDRTFANGILSDNPQDFFKNTKMKTSKYQLMGEDYQNSLSSKEQENHYKAALSNFSDENGNFDIKGAKQNLIQKFHDGVIDENQLYSLTDTLHKSTGTGIYTPKQTMQDKLNLLKTQAEIGKINSDIAKNNHSMSQGINENDPLAKEKNIYQSLIQAGAIKDISFGTWLNETGGKVNANIKLENVTSAKNKLRDQFSGAEQLINLMNSYKSNQAGALDGPIQFLREATGLHTQDSATLESNRNQIHMALTKALAGGNPSNKDLAKAESIVGTSGLNTESGVSGKYKAALNQTAISLNETINQIENAGYDASKERERLKEIETLYSSLGKWDGSSSIQEYLKKTTKSNKTTTQNNSRILIDKTNPNSKVEKISSKPSWKDYE
ncbi:hypothetical protein ACNSOO_04550 [Aliarcobacter lanthieri]|uniref:hypothetical protein n=1 Tax=Aliarcobacter lanthieri TaxID=1355374 RepID=UPI003AB0964C